MGQRYHGKNAIIEIGTGSPLGVVCSFNTWSLSLGRDKIDVSTFCDTGKVQLLGQKTVEGSFDGFFVKEDAPGLFTAADADTSTTIRITPTSLEPNVYFEGPAWLAIDNVGGSTTGAITMTVSFTADGDWTTSMTFAT